MVAELDGGLRSRPPGGAQRTIAFSTDRSICPPANRRSVARAIDGFVGVDELELERRRADVQNEMCTIALVGRSRCPPDDAIGVDAKQRDRCGVGSAA
jgi:hypothetical protein